MNLTKIFLISIFMLLLCGSLFAQEREYQVAKVIFAGGKSIQCQLADTLLKRSIGLKYHNELPPGTGMLFVYPYPSRTSFWMPPEMKFNLDMVFLDRNRRIVHLAANATPCKDVTGTDCESYSPSRKVSYVIEIPAGEVARLGLKKGNLVKIQFPKGFKFPKE